MQNQQMQSGAPDLITRREAAHLLRVHTETVKRWQRAGRLRAYVLSATVVRYSRADVLGLLSGCTVGA